MAGSPWLRAAQEVVSGRPSRRAGPAGFASGGEGAAASLLSAKDPGGCAEPVPAGSPAHGPAVSSLPASACAFPEASSRGLERAGTGSGQFLERGRTPRAVAMGTAGEETSRFYDQ